MSKFEHQGEIARKVLGKWYDENKQIGEPGCIFPANRWCSGIN